MFRITFIFFLKNLLTCCLGNPRNDSVLQKTDLDCYDDEKVLWWDGNCYPLLTQGPCQDGHWLQLASTRPRVQMECVAKPCPDEEIVWFSQECRCVTGDEKICGDGEDLLWSPGGEGLCGCLDDHEEFEDGVCYQVGTQGPCQDQRIWQVVDEDMAACVHPDAVVGRIFDLIPNNAVYKPRRRRKANVRNCWVDSRGRCRRRFRLRKRGGRDYEDKKDERPGLEYLDWLNTFHNILASGECGVQCEGDRLPWVDGECYELVSRGPCSNGSWLVLHRREERKCLMQALVGNQAVMRCEEKKCGHGDIWWPESCSCVSRHDGGVCEAGEVLSIGPYGEGICAKALDSDISTYIFDLIPTNEDDEERKVITRTTRSCHVDENGTCRRVLRIRNLRRRVEFEDFVDWLSGFKQRTKVNRIGHCII